MIELIYNVLTIEVVIVFFTMLILTIYSNAKLNKINIELKKAKDSAEHATKVKSNFIANISHEIRTPMNSIVGMAHLIQETNLTSLQKNYIQNIDTSTTNMLKLINQILDFSKIESNMLELNEVNFNLAELLNHINNIVSVKAYHKDLDFNIIYDKSQAINLLADNLKLIQILTNITLNAVKFTNSGFVELRVKEISNNIFQFRIQDSGIGLSSDQISKIFDPFVQADEGTTRRYGGSGLGLTISKELVKLMGGKIWVNSITTKGSEFIFEVPLKKSCDESKIINNTIINKNNFYKKEIKPVISEKDFKRLFGELKIAVSKRRPNLCEPLILELNTYKLKVPDEGLYKKITKFIRQYKFNEAMELFNAN